jgi:lipoyl(octanoyl) transferase
VYPLIELRRRGLNVRELVVALENAVIAYAAELGVTAHGSREAPGVYVDGAKLASVGLRIRRGASYHGLALNVSLDLSPFERINVCGHRGLTVTRLADHVARFADRGATGAAQAVGTAAVDVAARELTPHLLRQLKIAPEGVNIAPAAGALDAPSGGALAHSAINTDLQAVNSR